MCWWNKSAHFCLNGLLKETSSGCKRLVHPGGIRAGVVPISLSLARTALVFCALCTSATRRCLEPSFSTAGHHISSIHIFMTSSSHHAFFWKQTVTRSSHCCFSLTLRRFPAPLKMMSGLTRGFPSEKTVNCTVHCRLSYPDCPPLTQIVLFPFSENVFPPPNTNGIGVWSILAMALQWPTLPVFLRINRWNFLTTVTLSAGGFCPVDVHALFEIPCLLWNFSSQPFENLMGWAGFSWRFIALAVSQTTNPWP